MSNYSYANGGATPAATCTDLFTIVGVAGRIIEVKYVFVSGASSVAGQMTPTLVRRSTPNSGGSSTNPAELRHDQFDQASGTTLTLYTANPTLGTTVGIIKARDLTFLTNTVSPDRIEWNLSNDLSRPIRLSGITDMLALNFGGGAVPTGASINFEIEWGLR